MTIQERFLVLLQCNCGCGCGCNTCGSCGSSFYVPSFSVRQYVPTGSATGITGPTGPTEQVL